MGQVGGALTAVVEGLESGDLDAATQHVRKGFSLRAAPGKTNDADSARPLSTDQTGADHLFIDHCPRKYEYCI